MARGFKFTKDKWDSILKEVDVGGNVDAVAKKYHCHPTSIHYQLKKRAVSNEEPIPTTDLASIQKVKRRAYTRRQSSDFVFIAFGPENLVEKALSMRNE